MRHRHLQLRRTGLQRGFQTSGECEERRTVSKRSPSRSPNSTLTTVANGSVELSIFMTGLGRTTDAELSAACTTHGRCFLQAITTSSRNKRFAWQFKIRDRLGTSHRRRHVKAHSSRHISITREQHLAQQMQHRDTPRLVRCSSNNASGATSADVAAGLAPTCCGT